MKQQLDRTRQVTLLAILALLLPTMATAFDSGSTGADGAFNPQVDTELQLPADGVFNFTTVTIPSGVIVTFAKNTINTPVTVLASGDITIDGNIYLIGGNATHVGATGDGNIGDDGLPGIGAPGGFDGGSGGLAPSGQGGHALGPGGGKGGVISSTIRCGGGGGGYNGVGDNATCGVVASNLRGSSYGSVNLLPLIGGSGGGGGAAGNIFGGSGGGGGGGAILLASSGRITINGSIKARGGLSGNTSTTHLDNGSGGGGSGGAIRIIATTIAGNGVLNANRSGAGASQPQEIGGNGAPGRIRLESETFLRTSATTPAYSFAPPGDIFVADLPSLLITHVAGASAPASPTGTADIVLPQNTINPVLVRFATSGVPVGNTVKLTLTPPNGTAISAISNALAGSDQVATAEASIDLPDGPSTLSASVSFTVTAEDSIALSSFTKGEKVATVTLDAKPGQGSTTTLTTVSGKQYTMASNVAAM